MNKKITLIIMVLSLLVLSACASSDTAEEPSAAVIDEGEVDKAVEDLLDETSPEETAPESAAELVFLTVEYENALPVGSQLAVGTMALDETENAVEADQVNNLLFFWNALLNMTTNETIAEDEVQALYVQIQENMQPEQVQAIADLQLTNESMREYMGQGMGGGMMGDMEITDEMKATAQAMRDSGEMPEGMTPGAERGGDMNLDGGGGGPGRGGETGSARFTNEAMAGLNPMLIQSVIDYLSEMAQ